MTTCRQIALRFLHPVLGALLLLGTPLAAAPQPNILLIYVDDLGLGDLGIYGHPVLQTPHIDALAHDGLRLSNYYAPSALCSPSRAGLLTGRHPYRTGIESWIPENSGIYLRDAEITLAEVLRAAGYATAHIGKWHLNSDLGSHSEPQPTDQGFDYYYGHNAFQLPHNHNPVNIFRNKTALPMQAGLHRRSVRQRGNSLARAACQRCAVFPLPEHGRAAHIDRQPA